MYSVIRRFHSLFGSADRATADVSTSLETLWNIEEKLKPILIVLNLMFNLKFLLLIMHVLHYDKLLFWGKDVNEHEIYKWNFLNIELYLLSEMNFN